MNRGLTYFCLCSVLVWACAPLTAQPIDLFAITLNDLLIVNPDNATITTTVGPLVGLPDNTIDVGALAYHPGVDKVFGIVKTSAGTLGTNYLIRLDRYTGQVEFSKQLGAVVNGPFESLEYVGNRAGVSVNRLFSVRCVFNPFPCRDIYEIDLQGQATTFIQTDRDGDTAVYDSIFRKFYTSDPNQAMEIVEIDLSNPDCTTNATSIGNVNVLYRDLTFRVANGDIYGIQAANSNDLYRIQTTNGGSPISISTVGTIAGDKIGGITFASNECLPDLEDPTISCPSDVTQRTDPSQCSAFVTIPAPTTADNCGVTEVANDFTGGPDASDTYPLGLTVVTWTVTDESGNTAQCSHRVTVEDTEIPSISCPAVIVVNNDPQECHAFVTVPTPSTNDNCAVESVLNDYNGSPNASDTYPVGVTAITWTAVDSSGNSNQCSMTVTVMDTESRMITCPPDIVQNTDPGACSAFVSMGPTTVSENCALVNVLNNYNGTPDGSDTYPLGSTLVTWTATDNSGNTSQCSLTVTVEDAEAPTLSCPADITVANDPGDCQAFVAVPTPAASDNCPGVTVTNDQNGQGDASGIYPIGTTVVTWTATDSSGNTCMCQMNVTVTDNEAPSLTCPPDVSASNDPGECSTFVTVAPPSFDDNCGVESALNDYNFSPDGSDVYSVGRTVVTWTATDTFGNTTQCTMNVDVVDTELPTLLCPEDVRVSVPPGATDVVVTYEPPVGSDNCPDAVITLEEGLGSGGTFLLGTTTDVYQITDTSGNVAMCSVQVTVNDAFLFLRGDCDANGIFNGLPDALFLLNFQFVPGSPEPPCREACDADNNRVLNGLIDALFILECNFVPGSSCPDLPWPDCGPDPEPTNSLACDFSDCN